MNEKIKNYLGIALILGTLSVAYVGVNFATSYQPYPGHTFSVSGEGEVVAIPDVGRFSFSVLTEGGTDLEKLQKENTDKSNTVIAFLKGKNIDEKDIKSDSYNVSPTYQYYECNLYGVCPPAKISGYRVEHSVSVTVRNLDDSGALLSGAVENGANTVSNLSFEVDDLDKVENEARIPAIVNAKEKAKALAEATGFRVGKIVSIYTVSPDPYYGGYDYGKGGGDMMYAEDAYTPPQLEPGSQKVVVTVDITYEIK